MYGRFQFLAKGKTLHNCAFRDHLEYAEEIIIHQGKAQMKHEGMKTKIVYLGLYPLETY